jgi:hypothetical protein
VEGFLRTNSMSITDFYKVLQAEQGLCKRGGKMKGLNTTFGSVLLSATDFFDFCQMMYEVNQGGEAVFCPPLIDCDDQEEYGYEQEQEDKAESKKTSNEYKEDYDDQSKAQCK